MDRRLQRAHWFLNFWFSPWGAAKGAIWESLSANKPFTDAYALAFLQEILSDNPLTVAKVDAFRENDDAS